MEEGRGRNKGGEKREGRGGGRWDHSMCSSCVSTCIWSMGRVHVHECIRTVYMCLHVCTHTFEYPVLEFLPVQVAQCQLQIQQLFCWFWETHQVRYYNYTWHILKLYADHMANIISVFVYCCLSEGFSLSYTYMYYIVILQDF